VQEAPRAILALRYFYEEMPNLHVIAAGSLLEFAIAKVGVPVGRISMFYMYPLSFLECLVAKGHYLIAKEILEHLSGIPIEVKSGHGKTLRSLHLFLETHPKSTSAIRFSSLNYSLMEKLDSRPLYAAASLAHETQKQALLCLVSNDF
jgi:predicted AAA+ superfamily ATPase